jgi:porin
MREELKIRRRVIEVFLAVAMMTCAPGFSAVVASEEAASPGWLERDTLIGDWGGVRPWLQERGITLKPRLTQCYQGMTSGDDDHEFKYGGKGDLLLTADLSKVGLWNGFSLTVHGEYNFDEDFNGRGGTIARVNTALYFPGMEGPDRSDLSSVYFGQRFGDSISLLFGKINIIDIAAPRPFAGGAGIDSFWNVVFVAPPSGTVPPYLFGALLSWRTKPATFGLWVYDPNDMTNKSGLEHPFSDGITFRGTVEFPVTIAGPRGHQGLVALYSTMDGNNMADLDDLLIPPWPTPSALRTIAITLPIRSTSISTGRKKSPGKALGSLDSSASRTAIPIGFSGRATWGQAAPA